VEEAIRLANSTPYGLAAYVYTDDLGEADEFSYGLESGNVAINNPDAGVINAPYGGFKDSGQGYEHGPEGLEQYLQARHIRIRYFNRKA
jgi:succinate-semialdehyde dehydrogenase/glutarate-semialdehyde dehydrogenase